MKEDKIISNETQDEAGQALSAQKHQHKQAKEVMAEQEKILDQLDELNEENSENLDYLLTEANKLLGGQNIDTLLLKSEAKVDDIKLEPIDLLPFNEEHTWSDYLKAVHTYAEKHQLDLKADPFEKLLTESQRVEIINDINEDYSMQEAHCDKYDYALAALSGVITGIVDSVFVGMPGQSKLGDWSDKKTDQIVIRFAELITGEKFTDSKKRTVNKKDVMAEPISLAIEKLENIFKVQYDQPTGKVAGSLFNMSASNHHMKSLAHSLSPVGLVFSVIDQLSGTSHFVDNGRLITYSVPKDNIIPAKGDNLIDNIFYGIVNWFGHIMSDIAGSSGTRMANSSRRGMGVPIPGFELLQFIGKKYDNDKDIAEQRRSIADFSVDMFVKGYDFRFGVSQSIPVALNELLIRFFWGLKQRYYHDYPWEECIPFGGSKPELRRMLLAGHGVLCLIDGIDAGIRAHTFDKVNPDARGNTTALNFALRLNYIGWNRLALSGLLEIRAMYKEETIDITALDDDLEKEWQKLSVSSK